MKNAVKSLIAIAILLVGFGSLQAQSKSTEKAEFKVYGNCGMCEARIEKAASGVKGVESADWNRETKMMEVTYHPNQVKLIDIHKAIAAVGHDTDKVKAEDNVYSNLPGCCKYERNTAVKDGDNQGHHNHGDMK